MRLATCQRGHFTVMGSIRAVAIAPGWQGDLDQVVGETVETDAEGATTRHPLTLGEAIGETLVAAHFEIASPPRTSRRAAEAPVAPSQE